MPILNFYQLADQIFSSYQNREYDKALQLSLKAHDNFSKHHNLTGHWIAKAYSHKEEKDKALKYLKEWSDEGYWIKPDRLENDTDFNSIKDSKEFRQILEISKNRHEEAQAKASPKYTVFTPDNYSAFEEYQFLMAIHWRAGTMDEFAKYYKGIVEDKEFILASVQSSQPCGVNQFCWDDYDKAQNEIKNNFLKISNEYRIDNDKVILSGASQGGKLCIGLALKGLIISKGFISVIPYIPEIDSYIQILGNMKEDTYKTKGFIITGDKDISYDNTIKLIQKMKQAGIRCKMEVIEGMGHTVPMDFPKRLKNAVDFIFE